MRESNIFVALRIGNHFLCPQFGILPFAQLGSILDHLFLARVTMAAILLVGFFEFIHCGSRHALVQKLLRVLVGLLRALNMSRMGGSRCSSRYSAEMVQN